MPDENFLLCSDRAVQLYEEAKSLPVIDYHNHLVPADIAGNARYKGIYELWLGCDPYKHRLMRICGVPEKYITGEAEPYEKFSKFCEVFPLLTGNPVYDWSLCELKSVFGIDRIPNAGNAREIYDEANAVIADKGFTNNALLEKFNVEYQSPVASLFDDLSPFDGKKCAPSLRADNLLLPDADIAAKLLEKTGKKAEDLDAYAGCVGEVLRDFRRKGASFADTAVDSGFAFLPDDGHTEEYFRKSLRGEPLTKEERFRLATAVLTRLASLYEKNGMTMLLHLGAKRDTSERLRRLAGSTGGFAGAGSIDVDGLCGFLGGCEASGLPKTVLFPLNMADVPRLAVLQGSYSEDGVPSKVQLGAAWWWCDHIMGMRYTLDCISSFGVLSQFIGMTTDSRSVLSFARHDYFRRVLCSYIAEKAAKGEITSDLAVQKRILRMICYENAKSRILPAENK